MIRELSIGSQVGGRTVAPKTGRLFLCRVWNAIICTDAVPGISISSIMSSKRYVLKKDARDNVSRHVISGWGEEMSSEELISAEQWQRLVDGADTFLFDCDGRLMCNIPTAAIISSVVATQ